MMSGMEKEYQLAQQLIANKPARIQKPASFIHTEMAGHEIAIWNVEEEVYFNEVSVISIRKKDAKLVHLQHDNDALNILSVHF